MQQTCALAQQPVNWARYVPEGLMGAADVILGIVAVGDRWGLIGPAGREIVGRNNTRQNVWAEKSIRTS